MVRKMLYDAQTIDSLPWPSHEDGEYAKRFLLPLLRNGIPHYIDNIQADLFALKVGSFVFPVLVPQRHGDNSYVCSPYHHYITYGKENVTLIQNKALSSCVKQLFSLLGACATGCALDSVVYVNHWLSATDLYPEGIAESDVKAIIRCLKERFPKRAIIFRSLTPLTNPALMQVTKGLGFLQIPSRPVFISDGRNEEVYSTRIFKSDIRLQNKNLFEHLDESQLTPEDCAALLHLEHDLYVNHHSELQPQPNLRYVQLLLEQRLLHFAVLKEGNRFKGVAGYVQRNGTLSCPFSVMKSQIPTIKMSTDSSTQSSF